MNHKISLSSFGAAAVLMMLPLASICQVGPAGGPEDAVPFDDNMNFIFLAAAIVFAMVITWKRAVAKKVILK